MDSQGPLSSTRSQGQTSISEKRDGGAKCQVAAGSKHSYHPDPVPRRNRSSSPATSIFSRSSGWSGLPRGSLRVILEKAISRWARVSSGSSTISSTSSVLSAHNSRRARPSSIATSHTTHTETIIRARRQAWEQGRGIPREFLLFLPNVLVPQVVGQSSQDRRICRSASLPLVLSQLDSAIKRTAKSRRSKDTSVPSGKQTSASSSQKSRGSSIPWGKQSSVSSSHTLQDKGKFREDPPIRSFDKSQRRPAWWLDVSSPTWNDMREIGKLLHIHPLTLEDILQQEPREKLEVFPRLGYYFIVFRALESERTRATARAQLDLTMKGDNSAIPFTNGMIGATNVYIIVFRDGICTFHFQDISEHTSRVRNRIMQFEQTFHVSSDWIAHGVLDSIVDEVFPLLDLIEREIKDLDHIVLSISGPLNSRGDLKHGTATKDTESKSAEDNEVTTVDMEKINTKSQTESSGINESPRWSIRYADSSSGKHYFHRLTSIFAILKAKQRLKLSPSMASSPSSPSPLVRMASTRRLVTSLARLLGSKSDVVSQTRKRLTQGLAGSDVSLSEQGLTGEVGIYLGDIQDHILSLQQSLAYYERMLSQLHPAYIAHLRASLAEAKTNMDRRFFVLSLFASSVMVMDAVSSLCATNINVPSNNQAATPPAPFNYFIGIVILECSLAVGVLFLVHWFRRMSAKRRFTRARRTKSPNEPN